MPCSSEHSDSESIKKDSRPLLVEQPHVLAAWGCFFGRIIFIKAAQDNTQLAGGRFTEINHLIKSDTFSFFACFY